MFGLFAALNSLLKPREGREALNYENYIRTGEKLPSHKIYRESSIDRQTRKELASIRSKERIEQQIKFIRLMKKLLIQAENEISDTENDEELEQMRIKVTQLELKIEKAARAKDINCEDMFNMDKPDDPDDIQLEQIIRKATLNIPSKPIEETAKIINENIEQASGDNRNISSSLYDNQLLIERIRKKK